MNARQMNKAVNKNRNKVLFGMFYPEFSTFRENLQMKFETKVTIRSDI